MPTALENLAGTFQAKSAELAAIFEAKKTSDGRYDMTAEELDDVKARRLELDTLGSDYHRQRDLSEAEKKNAADLKGLNTPIHPSSMGGYRTEALQPEQKSLGERVVESAEFKSMLGVRKAGGSIQPFRVAFEDFSVKTVMAETGAGFSAPNYRTNIVIPSAQRRPVVADLIPQDPTTLEAIKYMEETTFTNNAAMTAEGALLGEAALNYTERTVLVEWLGTTLPVTEQQLEDVPQVQGIINNRLMLQVALSEEIQLLSGTGSSPQLQGFLTKSGIGTQAMGADPIFDAVMKALTQVRFTGFADPSGIIFNPVDWQTVRLVKTTIGSYIMGNPDMVGPQMLFGLPVIVTPAISQGTALTGDFQKYSQLNRRAGMNVEVGYVSDDFARGKKTIRAMERLALLIYRAAAFSTVTGIHA